MVKNITYKAVILTVAFLVNSSEISLVKAQDFILPKPGVMVGLSPAVIPPMLKGIKIHSDNPFRFEFILDGGDIRNDQRKEESGKLIKYFLASLTIPEKDLWVNLSPYEKNRIVPELFGQTEMGRDLLAQDYILKQITASLIYPEGKTGKKFWAKVYAQTAQQYGNTDIPVKTFNKVWIVPEKAVIYENAKAGTAYVVESTLKVMLEDDYLALNKFKERAAQQTSKKEEHEQHSKKFQGATQIIREVIIPELTHEVNKGKNFSQLRQIYNSLILATWYKQKITDSILSKVFVNRNKIYGVNIDDPEEKERIYKRYLEAFKKGAYNYIKEEVDLITHEKIPRKHFSGGENLINVDKVISYTSTFPLDHVADKAILSVNIKGVDQAMANGAFVARRLMEIEILNMQLEPITIRTLWELLKKKEGYADVKAKDVKNDVNLDTRLKNNRKLIIKKIDRSAIEQRKLKEIEILNRQRRPITNSRLLELLRKEDGYADVRAETLRSDILLDNRLKEHKKLIIKRLDLKAVEVRRLKELAVLNLQQKPITIKELWGFLKKEDGYDDVKIGDVKNDVTLDARLKGHSKIKKEVDRKEIMARRLMELTILDQQSNPITIRTLWELLKKKTRFINVKIENVKSDVANEVKLRTHKKIKKEIDSELIEARRLKEIKILDAQSKPITIRALWLLLKKDKGFVDITLGIVKRDVVFDNRLKGHVNIKKAVDREVVMARRLMEIKILNQQRRPITISELWKLLKNEDGYADVEISKVRNDFDLDNGLKNHAKINIKRDGNFKDIIILLEGSDLKLLNSIKNDLENGGYAVKAIVIGEKQIERSLKEDEKINFVISEGEIDRKIIGRRKFINLGNYLNEDEELINKKRFFDEVDRLSSQDNAQITNGGIDLTSPDIQAEDKNNKIIFNVNPAMLTQFQNTPGFVPVIINDEPLINLRYFLELPA